MRYGLDPPIQLVKPPTCHWCGGNMRLLRHVFKGRNSSHEYCSEKCLMRGLEREAHHVVTASRLQSPWYIGLAAVLAVFLLAFATTGKARAQEINESHLDGHSQYHDAYSKWLRNDTHTSCCNLRVMSLDGKTVISGDCRPVEAELRLDDKGELHWWAQRERGDPPSTWIRIPDSTIVRERNPDLSGNSAHLCATPSTIYCFVGSTGTN